MSLILIPVPCPPHCGCCALSAEREKEEEVHTGFTGTSGIFFSLCAVGGGAYDMQGTLCSEVVASNLATKWGK